MAVTEPVLRERCTVDYNSMVKVVDRVFFNTQLKNFIVFISIHFSRTHYRNKNTEVTFVFSR